MMPPGSESCWPAHGSCWYDVLEFTRQSSYGSAAANGREADKAQLGAGNNCGVLVGVRRAGAAVGLVGLLLLRGWGGGGLSSAAWIPTADSYGS